MNILRITDELITGLIGPGQLELSAFELEKIVIFGFLYTLM